MSAKPNVKQDPRLISREYTWSNISFVRQWKKYRREWSKCVSVLVLALFCYGELKRVLWAWEGNDNLYLTFISCCKSASVLRNLLLNYPHLGPVLEMWHSGVRVAVNPCCNFGSPTDQSTSRFTLMFYLELQEAKHRSCPSVWDLEPSSSFSRLSHMMGPCKEEQKCSLAGVEFLGTAGRRMPGWEAEKSLEEICVNLCTPRVTLHCSVGSFLFQPFMHSQQHCEHEIHLCVGRMGCDIILGYSTTAPFYRI